MTEEMNLNEHNELKVQDENAVTPQAVPTEAEMNALMEEKVETLDLNEEEHELEAVETEEDAPNYAQLSKAELLEAAIQAVKEKDATEATHIFKVIKPLFEHHIQEEFNAALHKFIEEGGEKDNFEFKGDGSREVFYNAYKELKQKKTDERNRQEAEKQNNLKKKEDILEQIRILSEAEETNESLKKLKELQNDWKQIRNIPKEHIERTWEMYRLYLDRFYDRLTIFNELKDLDRRKNLDHKIELTKKVTELALEPSIKKALILLKKYQEEWKNIGPVPKESNEDIWTRFKQECDKIYEMVKAFQAENDRKREENLAAKKELLAKALQYSNFESTRIKEWLDHTTTVNQLMEDWKKIGQVPLKFRDEVWNEFRQARNHFFTNKNVFFKKLQAERNENLKAKTELCQKAEAIANHPLDWNKQTDELKKLQEQWKKSGPVHDKISDTIWKRFRSACDMFFEKKAHHYAAQVEDQKINLETKRGLIAKLEELHNREDGANIIHDLKAIQDEWNNTGFVPMSQKEEVTKKYQELNDKVFQKFRQANQELRELKDRSHLEALAHSPNGLQKVKREERALLERIKGLRNDISTWDNNLGFFARASADNPMVVQIKDKINAANKQIAQLEDKLKNIRSFIRQEEKA